MAGQKEILLWAPTESGSLYQRRDIDGLVMHTPGCEMADDHLTEGAADEARGDEAWSSCLVSPVAAATRCIALTSGSPDLELINVGLCQLSPWVLLFLAPNSRFFVYFLIEMMANMSAPVSVEHSPPRQRGNQVLCSA